MTKAEEHEIEEQTMDQPIPAENTDATEAVEPQVEDVLVEEVSIDGMCGVY